MSGGFTDWIFDIYGEKSCMKIVSKQTVYNIISVILLVLSVCLLFSIFWPSTVRVGQALYDLITSCIYYAKGYVEKQDSVDASVKDLHRE